MFQSANAAAASAQADKKKSAKSGNKHTVEATADDTEGTSKVGEEPAPESKKASESVDYGASQLHEFSQVITFAAVLLKCTANAVATHFELFFSIWIYWSFWALCCASRIWRPESRSNCNHIFFVLLG